MVLLIHENWASLLGEDPRVAPDVQFRVTEELSVGGATVERTELVGAHKFVLSMASDVFNAQFCVQILEEEEAEISITGISIEVFKEFLKLIYSLFIGNWKVRVIKDEYLADILDLCKNYKVEDAVSFIAKKNAYLNIEKECIKKEILTAPNDIKIVDKKGGSSIKKCEKKSVMTGVFCILCKEYVDSDLKDHVKRDCKKIKCELNQFQTEEMKSERTPCVKEYFEKEKAEDGPKTEVKFSAKRCSADPNRSRKKSTIYNRNLDIDPNYKMDPNCKIFIGGLREGTTKYDLEVAFINFGNIKSVWLARKGKGFAFVEMEDARDAKEAVRGLDGGMIGGGRVTVEMSNGGGGENREEDKDGEIVSGGRENEEMMSNGSREGNRVRDEDRKDGEINRGGRVNKEMGNGGGGGNRYNDRRSRSRSPRRSSKNRDEGRNKKTSFSRDREDVKVDRRICARDDRSRERRDQGRNGISDYGRSQERQLGESEWNVQEGMGNSDNYKRQRRDIKSARKNKIDPSKDSGRGFKPRNKGRSRSKSPSSVEERLKDLQRSLLKPMPQYLQNWTKSIDNRSVKRDSGSLSVSPDLKAGGKKSRRSGSLEKIERRENGDANANSFKRNKKDRRKFKNKMIEENNISPKRDPTPPRRRKNQRLTNERDYEESDE